MMNDITFAHPHFLWLMALIPLLIVWYWLRAHRAKAALTLTTMAGFNRYLLTWRHRILHLPFILRLLALAALSVAMARPQSTNRGQNITSEGIDIVLAVDVSGSMLAEDFRPNRIEAAKKVAREFILGRPTDRIGLVIFSGESYTQCPITTDHPVLLAQLMGIKSGILEDGTALGEGLATSVARLKDSDAKSKVIILLTDGVNNIGSVAPLTAGEIASTFNIRVYTVGVGTTGTAPYPIRTPFGVQYQNMEVQIDETVLKEIANLTGGKYFRATNNNKLADIYTEIDRMEKTKINVIEFSRHTEEYFPWVLAALAFLFIDILLKTTVLKTLP